MIEKMKFLSITGPKADIDRVVDTYLSRYEIHLENALSELKTVKDLRPYIETNPYKEKLNLARELAEKIGGQLQSVPEKELPSQEEAAKTVDDISSRLKELNDKKEELQAQIQTLKRSKDQVEPFTELNYSVKEILGFQFIKFRFGRISREYFDKFNSYVYETIDTVMFKCLEDAEYVWIVYFVPEKLADKIDAIYASMHFERCFLPDEYEGTPMEAEHVLDDKIKALEAEKQELEGKILQTLDENKQELAAACTRLERFSVNFDVRKMAACTKHGYHTFYILCGWMSETDAKKFQKEIESDADTFCIIEDDHNNIMSTPPTKMKNPGLFKPFEMYVEMYGLPSYNEIDPTILIGITYSILFGFMFGDAGQGLCLLIGGFLLYKFKKMRLAGIISCCGFFSTIFGVLFGSVFGFEDIIDAVWLRPQEAMTDLPFIGKLNTVFVVAIAIGMGIILLCMILNIINSVKEHNTEKTWFDTNGAAGLVFYFALAAVIVCVLAMGITSMGGPERIVRMMTQDVGDREVEKVSTSHKIKMIESEDEEKAYQEIRNKFGTDVVKLSICLNNMKFDTMNLNEDKQIAEMYYTYNEKTIAYFINMPYRDNSWGVDFEDPIEKEYTKKIEDCSIEVTIYKLKESKKSSCVAKFKYDNIEYLLMGTTTQEEFEKILKSLVFPK